MTPEEQDAAMIMARQACDQLTAALRIWAPLYADIERALIEAGVSESAAAIVIGNHLARLMQTGLE